MSLTLRAPTPVDVEPCARIIHAAFADIADRHGFPHDFANLDEARLLARIFIGRADSFGVVAERDGVVVGSNFLDERGPIRGVGPISVDPGVQGAGLGRRLMQAVIERGQDAVSIRLVQDSFNMTSLSLYTSLGFETREPLVLLRGVPRGTLPADVTVRRLAEDDLDACATLCTTVHGFDRRAELRDASQIFASTVAVRDEHVVAYASAPHFWKLNHGVAESEEDLRALLLGSAALEGATPLELMVPIRCASFYAWCLAAGLRAVKPMNLMSRGAYLEPRGSFYPSVMF